MKAISLKDRLDCLYRTFDVTMLSPDPLETVREFHLPEDQEIAGLIAASLAYGRVELILKALGEIFDLMENRPYFFVMRFDPATDGRRFEGFVYRMSKGRDIVCLLMMLQEILRNHGSLRALFESEFNPADADIGPTLGRFVDRFLGFRGTVPYPDEQLPKRGGVRYFLPSPGSGSACKRLNLFMRWMVRNGEDGIDLGIWRGIPASMLVIPVDTHIARMARSLGLTKRNQADWKMAAEITDALKAFDPDDPVKYDFALCHWSMRQIRGHEQGLIDQPS